MLLKAELLDDSPVSTQAKVGPRFVDRLNWILNVFIFNIVMKETYADCYL